MKKLTSLLLAMLMLCTMFSAFALPTAAESYADFWWEIREDLTIGDPENPYEVDTEEYICHLRLIENASVTVLPWATVKVSSLNLEDAGTLKIEGKVYSDHLLFFGLGDIELEEDGILDLNRVETDIPDEYLQGLRKKGYCVHYENRHLIVTTKHEFSDTGTGLCSICGADCHHDYDEELVCRLCGHYPGGLDVFDISFDEDATVSGFHRYDITIASGATVTVEPSGNIFLTSLKGEGTLIVRGTIYGIVDRMDPGITVIFEDNGTLDLTYSSYVTQSPFPADDYFEKMRENGAACMAVKKEDDYYGEIYASAEHPWEIYSDVHYCPKCEAEAAHDGNDGVCRVCGGNCEHWFDDDDVCYYCGHKKDTLDYLRERITEDLTVPAGDYTISSLQVEPGVTVTVEPGAHIRAENGIGSYGATLVIRGSVTAYFTEFSGSSGLGRKTVGTVILEGDGIFDFVATPRSCPFGEAGVGHEFVQELADSGLPCYFAPPSSHCHAAKIHTWENGICIGCGELQNGGSTGSIFSEGNLWILAGVSFLALGGVAALVIVKKKRKE